MATKRKQPSDERVEGYLHTVSPIKQSRDKKTEYFNAIIQTNEEYRDMVIFNRNIGTVHQNFVDMQDKRSAVCLIDVDKVPSLRRQGRFDIKFTNYSRLTSPVRQLDFAPHTPKEESTDLKGIEKMASGAQISFRAKVTKKSQTSETFDKNQRKLRKHDFVVADKTSAVTLVAWEDTIDKIQLGQTYVFKNISVRTFGDVKSLTTNQNSVIKPTQDIGGVSNVQVKTDEIQKQLHITAAKCTVSYKCGACNKVLIVNKHVPVTKCEQCHMQYKVSSLRQTTSCEVISDNSTYTIPDSVLGNCLPDIDKTEDEIGLYFLMQEHFKVKCRQSSKIITSFEPYTCSATSVKETQPVAQASSQRN